MGLRYSHIGAIKCRRTVRGQWRTKNTLAVLRQGVDAWNAWSYPEVGAAQVRCAKVKHIMLASLLMSAPEDSEDGLNICRRPDLRWGVFRLFRRGALAIRLVPAAGLELDEGVAESLRPADTARVRARTPSMSP